MIEIDGSIASGGGQVLRTAVGLAAVTGKPCKVFNIRAKRRNPGLREQQLQAVKSVSRLCRGKLVGAEIGSREIEFEPGVISEKEVTVRIATAGSIGLVLQALMIAASVAEVKIRIEGGGTYGKWAPPVAYIDKVLGNFLKEMGYEFDVKILKEGFFPKGGAEVEVCTRPASWKPVEILKRGGVLNIGGVSAASLSLKEKKIAERQVDASQKILYEYFKTLPSVETSYSPALCPGSGLQLWMDTESLLRIGESSVGELGRRAEEVGREAARRLIREYEGGGVDSHAADQLLPYLALAGGRIKVNGVTDHCRANIFVIEKFLPVKFKVEEKIIEVVRAE